jgi:hypothetical protein
MFDQVPDMPAVLADKIRLRIQSDTLPVQPMMSVGSYGLLFGGVFAAVAILFATVIGLKGLPVLSPIMAAELLSVLVALGLWGGWMVARSMRPGSGRLHLGLLAGVAVGAYEGLVLLLFRDFSTTRFVESGGLCLLTGVLCAAIVAMPVWLIVRRGFMVDSVRAGALIGLLSGLAGLTALTLHCPIITAPHAGVWHAAVPVLCVAAGALAGRAFRR